MGTHDYVFREIYHELKKPEKSFTFYILFRNTKYTGKVWFDDISVQTYQSPPVSVGTVQAKDKTSYQQVSSVFNSKLTVE